ncbi:MAG: hypothetical protein IKS54_00700 [Erysipelotrichaceae bacterium]|nr:hypothetical protein [Erysipelotrichaceae bacterium]
MELLSNYSGICAIIVYSIILAFILKSSKKKVEKETETEIQEEETQSTVMPLDLDDEDATVACLIAAIECRNESHKNVRIVSVREV